MAKKGQTFRKYTKEEKMEIIEVAIKTTQAIAAKEYGVKSSTISRWIKEYNEGGIERLADQRPTLGKNPLKGRPKKNFKSIEEQLEHALIQNDFLKKRTAKQMGVSVDELGLPSLRDTKDH